MDEELGQKVDELYEVFIAFCEVLVEADDLVLVRAAAGDVLDILDGGVTFEPDIDLEREVQEGS